jgi:hypothetical protein
MRSGGTAHFCAASSAAAVTHSSHKMAERVPIFLWRIRAIDGESARPDAQQSNARARAWRDHRGDLDAWVGAAASIRSSSASTPYLTLPVVSRRVC